jgi:flagellar hook-basal body complex protein FliE
MISGPGGIDSSRITAMIAQLKAAAASPSAAAQGINAAQGVNATQGSAATGLASAVNSVVAPDASTKVEFSDALKNALGSVNDSMQQADALGEKFIKGDNSVSLSDVMISGQKAGIAFQATMQARNKLVSAYHDIMNMQV